jgi:hypothetical protein
MSHHVGKVVEKLGRFLIVSASEFEQLRRALDEGGCGLSAQKLRVAKHVVQEPCIQICSLQLILKRFFLCSIITFLSGEKGILLDFSCEYQERDDDLCTLPNCTENGVF